ncbi:hypothetical protein SH139x_000189 [Planctomycetaceae bacterium SH139]
MRFPEVQAAVTITDDGSMSSSRRRLVDEHVRNVRWLPRHCFAPELTEALADRPQLRQLYKGDFHMVAKLLHPVVLGRCPAMFAMDADVAFFSLPERILNWAHRRGSDGLYLHDLNTRNAEVPWFEQMLAEIIASRSDLFCHQKLDHAFFNAGLLCYLRSACRLDAAEHFLAWRQANAKFNSQPFADTWLGDWTREQTAYLSMFLAMQNQPEGLGVDYRIGGPPWSVFHHFLRAGLVRGDVQERLRKLVNELS